MPAPSASGYRLEPFETRARLQLPLERLDPLLEIAVLDHVRGGRRIGASDVFATTSRFPFLRDGDEVRSAIPALEPGFVLRDDGRIFSRLDFPDSETGHRYHFQAAVTVAEKGGREALETAARLLREESVDSLYLGPRLRPQLDHSVMDACCAPPPLSCSGQPELDGRGVVIGVVDYGCDFVHRNFRHEDGRTRIAWLWDQNGSGGIPEASYGREYDAAAIDRALAEPDPYAALDYDPHRNYYTPGKVVAAHGTHVLDIAAGNGRGTGCPGMAPAADIIFVQLRRYDWTGDPDLNRTAAVLDAVAYIFARAGDRPAVVNLSLGTNGGSHDGTSIVERTLDMFTQVPGRAIVVAAGNAGGSLLHASGTIPPRGSRRLGWQFPKGDKGPNQLEVWADGPLALGLTDPSGRSLGAVEPDGTAVLCRDEEPSESAGDGHAGAVIGSRSIDADLHVTTAVIRPRGRKDAWAVDLISRSDAPIRFDAWIDRDDPGQSCFAAADADPEGSLASLACGRGTIVVGAHYALAIRRDLAAFSARGMTRDRRMNPHLTAPGYNVRAAMSKRDLPPKTNGRRSRKPAPRIAMSGTSMAAPHVTGAVALMLQAHPNAMAADIRQALIDGAAKGPFPTPSNFSDGPWHPGHGFGWLDLAAACRLLSERADERAPS